MKKVVFKKIIWFSVVPLIWTEYGYAGSSTECSPLPYEPKWNAETRLRFAASSRRSLGQVDLFAPVVQDESSLFFLDIRFWRDTKSNTEGNYGLAYRKLYPTLGWIFGGYGFFDNRRTEHDHFFQQFTLGLEALSERWDYRTNLYLPLSKAKTISSGKHKKPVFRGHEEYFTAHKDIPLKGFYAEIGRLVPPTDNLRLYAGEYHFQ